MYWKWVPLFHYLYWRVGPYSIMYTDGFHFSTTCILESGSLHAVNVLEMGSTFPLLVLESGSLQYMYTDGFHFSTTCILKSGSSHAVNVLEMGSTCTGEWVLTVNVLEMGSTFPLHVLESGSLYILLMCAGNGFHFPLTIYACILCGWILYTTVASCSSSTSIKHVMHFCSIIIILVYTSARETVQLNNTFTVE